MTHPKAHITKWTVFYIAANAVERFESEEAARQRALVAGEHAAVALIPPIYA